MKRLFQQMQIKCKYKETRAWEEKTKMFKDVSYTDYLYFFTSFKNQKVSIVTKKTYVLR